MKKRLALGILTLAMASNALAYYQAEQGRWLNRDPIGERGGVHLLGVLANDALNKVDKLGQSYGNPVSGPDGPVGPSDPFAPNPYDPPAPSPSPSPSGGGFFNVDCGGLISKCCSKSACSAEVAARGIACREHGTGACLLACGLGCIGTSGGYFACLGICAGYCELAVISGCSAGEMICYGMCASCPKD